MKIDNRQKVLLISAIAMFVLLVGDQLVLPMLTRKWKDNATRIADLRKSVAQGKTLLERENVIRNRWDGMRTNTLSADVSLAEQQTLKAFDRWSQESRISVTAIKPQWKRTADDYMTLECRVDAFGSLTTVSKFLHNIEKDPLGFKVETVELSARDENGSQLALGLLVSGLVLQAQDK